MWVRENVSVVNTAGRSTLTANMAQRVLSRSSGNKESVGVNHLNRSRTLQPGTRLYSPHKLQGGEGIKYDFQRGAFPTSKPHNDAHFADKESWQSREVLTNHDRSFYTWTVSGGKVLSLKPRTFILKTHSPLRNCVLRTGNIVYSSIYAEIKTY